MSREELDTLMASSESIQNAIVSKIDGMRKIHPELTFEDLHDVLLTLEIAKLQKHIDLLEKRIVALESANDSNMLVR